MVSLKNDNKIININVKICTPLVEGIINWIMEDIIFQNKSQFTGFKIKPLQKNYQGNQNIHQHI